MAAETGKKSPRRLSGLELFLAGWGITTLFFQLPLIKMVLDDPQSLYLGAWDNPTFVRFLLITFGTVPMVASLLSLALFKIHRLLSFVCIILSVSFFLAMSINVHYLQIHFLYAPWRREVTVALFLLPLIPLWLIRYSLVRLLKVCSLFSLVVLASFSLQAAPSRITASSQSRPVLSEKQIPHPIFIMTFEKLVAAYLTGPDGTFLSERFPNLADFLKTADYYPNAYANSTATVYALKSLYTGRFLTTERDWTKHPNLRDILGAHNQVYMFLDVLTKYCRLNRDIGFRMIGSANTLGSHLLFGWYRTYQGSIIPDPLEERLPMLGLDLSFNPLIHLWIRERDFTRRQFNGLVSTGVGMGIRQINALKEVLRQERDHPNIYLVHSFISDGPGTKTSVLTGRSETDHLKDLEAARKNLAVFDQQLGKFFQTLKQIGIYDQSLILITSDTGYDPQASHVNIEPQLPASSEMLKVFLSIKQPRQTRSRIIRSTIRQIDILPTLLADLQIDPAPYRFEGVPVTATSPTTGLAERPLEFSITSEWGGILHYQLFDPMGPLYKSTQRRSTGQWAK